MVQVSHHTHWQPRGWRAKRPVHTIRHTKHWLDSARVRGSGSSASRAMFLGVDSDRRPLSCGKSACNSCQASSFTGISLTGGHARSKAFSTGQRSHRRWPHRDCKTWKCRKARTLHRFFNQLKAHEFKNMRYPTSAMPGDCRIPLPRLVGPLGQDPSYIEETRPRRKGREELAPGRGLILGLNLPRFSMDLSSRLGSA